jgi:hypothetical protein
MSRHVERLDLRDHDGFERCVGYKATSFRALHLFLRGCERQLLNPVIVAHPADQLKSGRTSAPRLPQAVQVKRPSLRFSCSGLGGSIFAHGHQRSGGTSH